MQSGNQRAQETGVVLLRQIFRVNNAAVQQVLTQLDILFRTLGHVDQCLQQRADLVRREFYVGQVLTQGFFKSGVLLRASLLKNRLCRVIGVSA